MLFRPIFVLGACCWWLMAGLPAVAQQAPYDVFPDAEPPYYRVRYEASSESGGAIFPVNYSLWVPPGVERLRGVVVHQHGCGEGSCRSGLTGAWDLHWQALAREHGCALLSPAWEQPEQADCQQWCDPRNGSGASFLKALADLGELTGHPELSHVPWALWGHSGGGHWAGGMVMLYPERVAAAWLRSGVPLLEPDPARSLIRPHRLPEAALRVPIMCNPGTQEGVTVKDGRFAGVWPANEAFFRAVRARDGLIAVAVDPLSSHECGNQRYLAIPWLSACLSARLPQESGAGLRPMPQTDVWLAPATGFEAVRAEGFEGDARLMGWLPSAGLAGKWMEYVRDTEVSDETPPPAPENLQLRGSELSWECAADVESGLAGFLIERDGIVVGSTLEGAKNPFGRLLFQNLQYSDTPPQPLAKMVWVDPSGSPGDLSSYRVSAVNTRGLKTSSR
jgi:pimeloyl-ACP methyl ester carboxylesterase